MTTAKIFDDILQSADLLAAALVRRMRPAEDLISQRQAYEEYGRAYIRKRTAPRGLLKPMRMGSAPNSPIKYSRTEILALQEAERLQVQRWTEID